MILLHPMAQQGGDYRYDIYLTDNVGLTTPEDPSFQYPGRPAYTSFIQLGHDMRYPSRYGDNPYPFLKASIAHEFFHAIEFAYRVFSTDYTFWWFESCANWAEERVFTDVNDVYYSLPAYLSNPHHSLYRTYGQFTYGAWLFPEFIDERFGSDLIIACWEKFAHFDYSISAIAYTFQDAGLNINTEYCLHVIWNYFIGSNQGNNFYREGAYFNSSVFQARLHTGYPVDWAQAPVPLENMSSSYIVFERNDEGKSTLFIEYYNATTDQQAVCLAIIKPGMPAQYSIHDVNIGIPGIFSVDNFSRGDKVVLMPVWLFESRPKEDYSTYQYRAYLTDTLSTAVDDEDSPINQYSLDSVYPNPFNGAVSISFNAPASSSYAIRIYDIMGRAIMARDGVSHEGLNNVTWQAPADLASGVLFYVLDFGQKKLNGKMSLLK